MFDAIIKCLKHMNDISNSSIVENADNVLSQRKIDVSVD